MIFGAMSPRPIGPAIVKHAQKKERNKKKNAKLAPFELKISPSEPSHRGEKHGNVRFVQNPQNWPFLVGEGKQQQQPLLTAMADSHC